MTYACAPQTHPPSLSHLPAKLNSSLCLAIRRSRVRILRVFTTSPISAHEMPLIFVRLRVSDRVTLDRILDSGLLRRRRKGWDRGRLGIKGVAPTLLIFQHPPTLFITHSFSPPGNPT